MSSEERLAKFIAQSREARSIHTSRVSGLIKSIASSVPYEFDPADDGEQQQPSAEGGELPESQGEIGAMVGSAGEPNDSGSPERTTEEPSG